MLSWMENVLLGGGLIVVLFSYARYVRRTRDLRGVLMFWQRRMALTPAEFKLQRAGILVLFAGILLRYVNLTLVV